MKPVLRTVVIARWCTAVATLAVVLAATPALPDPAPRQCTVAERADWQFVHDQQLGLSVTSGADDYLGPFADRTKESANPGSWGNRNWFVADVVKKTLCGSLDRFELFSGPGAEDDFHFFLTPGPAFAYALDDLLPISSGAHTIWGEVTLPRAYADRHPFTCQLPQPLIFRSLEVPSCLTKGPRRQACVFGPWIFEDFHGNQPEIHPVEQAWFRDDSQTHWIVAQDASIRFGGAQYNYCLVGGRAFDCSAKVPAEYRGWSPWSLQVRARIPVAVADQGDARVVTVSEVARTGHAGGEKTGSQSPSTLRPFGASTLKVIYPGAVPASGKPPHAPLDVVIEDGCHDADGQRWLTYFDVTTPVESADANHEGQGFMHLAFSGLEAASTPSAPAGSGCRADFGPAESDPSCQRVEEPDTIVWLRREETPASLWGDLVSGDRSEALLLRGVGSEPAPAWLTLHAKTASPSVERQEAGWSLYVSGLRAWYEPRWREVAESDPAIGSSLERIAEDVSALISQRGASGMESRDPLERRRVSVDRYDRLFEQPFRFALGASIPGTQQTLEVEGACGSHPPQDASRPRLCLNGSSLPPHARDQKVLEWGLWVPDAYRESVALRFELRDPFGPSAPETLTLCFPWPQCHQGRLADYDGLLQDAVAGVPQDVLQQLQALWGLGRFDPRATKDLKLNASPDPACNRRAQLARLFRIYGMAASRDGHIDDAERDALGAIAGSFADARDGDPAACGR